VRAPGYAGARPAGGHARNVVTIFRRRRHHRAGGIVHGRRRLALGPIDRAVGTGVVVGGLRPFEEGHWAPLKRKTTPNGPFVMGIERYRSRLSGGSRLWLPRTGMFVLNEGAQRAAKTLLLGVLVVRNVARHPGPDPGLHVMHCERGVLHQRRLQAGIHVLLLSDI